MRLPAFAQQLGAAPSVMRMEGDAEHVAQLAVEVGEAGPPGFTRNPNQLTRRRAKGFLRLNNLTQNVIRNSALISVLCIVYLSVYPSHRPIRVSVSVLGNAH